MAGKLFGPWNLTPKRDAFSLYGSHYRSRTGTENAIFRCGKLFGGTYSVLGTQLRR